MNYDLITDDKIQPELRTHTFGKKIFGYWSLNSTNEFAYKLALKGEKEGTIVIAEEQTSGRGRMNRKWHSSFGKGLWFSIILRPIKHKTNVGLYPYLAGVSVAQAIENKIGLKPIVKWPNDLLFNDKKFCGILSEIEFIHNLIDFIILGIGINVNHSVEDFPIELQQYATSIRLESAHTSINRISLFAEIIYLLEEHYYFSKEHGFKNIIQNWKNRNPHIGKKINIIQNEIQYQGIFEDIDDDGYLLLREKNGNLIKVIAGDLYKC